MTYEEIKELPVLDGIIRETLRLHSPIHTIMVRLLRQLLLAFLTWHSVRSSLISLFLVPFPPLRKMDSISSPKATLLSLPQHSLK